MSGGLLTGKCFGCERYFIVAAAMALICLLFTAMVESSLPARIATHWGFDGKPNGFADRMSIVWLGAIPLFLLVMFYAIPGLDPLWNKYGPDAREKYWFLVLVFTLFFFGVVLLAILENIGPKFNVSAAVSVFIGLLFISLGYYFFDSKPSWFVGIRTPWAMMSENNWRKTHEMASWTFYVLGIAFVAFALLLPSAFPLIILITVVAAIALFGYSYLVYQHEQRFGRATAVVVSVPRARPKQARSKSRK
jgi:uncharacterized membrane protein